jgi:GxxExxY protein
MKLNEISGQVIDAAYHIHLALGPGLLKSVYQAVLAADLRERGLRVVEQQGIPVVYKGVELSVGFRADLVVEGEIMVEIKSIEAVAPVHKMQLLTHLRLANKQVGLLINFNVARIKDGITRIVNGFRE